MGAVRCVKEVCPFGLSTLHPFAGLLSAAQHLSRVVAWPSSLPPLPRFPAAAGVVVQLSRGEAGGAEGAASPAPAPTTAARARRAGSACRRGAVPAVPPPPYQPSHAGHLWIRLLLPMHPQAGCCRGALPCHPRPCSPRPCAAPLPGGLKAQQPGKCKHTHIHTHTRSTAACPCRLPQPFRLLGLCGQVCLVNRSSCWYCRSQTRTDRSRQKQ